nr:hypothetical protein [Tanacetum cinerariifolium]
MLTLGRYPQWRSRFLRYVDTRPNGEALRKCIMSGPYKPTTVLVHAVEATDNFPEIAEQTIVETPTNMYLENKAHFLAEKEAIHLILTGIRDDFYSIVNACQTAQEIFYKLMNEMIRNNLTVTTMQVNVQFLQQLQPEWSTFVTIVKQQHKLDEVSYHKLFDILKQYQNEVNELRAEKLAKNANPLALRDKDMQKNLALIAKYFKKIYKLTNNNLRTSSNSKNKNVDTTLRYKNDDQSRQFRTQRTVNVTAARENIGSKVVQQSGIQCFNCKEYGHFAKECRKPKWYDWLTDTDEEVDEQELEAHYSYMAKIQEVPTAGSGTDSEPVEQNEQNDVDSDDERVALANLIDNLKLDVDENKRIQKQLKKANTTLAQELKECKAILAETSKSLRESISVRDSCLVALQTKQAEFEKFKAFNNRTVDYDKLERKLNDALGQLAHKDTVIREGLKTKAYELSVVKEKHNELMKQSLLTKSHYEDLFRAPTALDIEILIQTYLMPLTIKTQGDSLKFIHELKQEMHADLKYVESLEKEIDELESEKAEFSDMYDVILQECVSKDVMCSYLQSLSDLDVLAELQCKNDTVCNEKASNGFRKEREQYIKIQDLKAKLQDKNIAISELKKLIEKGKGKSVDNKFDRPSVVRQPNAQRIPKPSVLGKATPFSNFLDRIYFQKTESLPKANVSESLSKPVTAQTLPHRAKKAIVQLILFIIDSGCTKHMTGNLKLLCNFFEKFLGTVRFGNDQFVLILGYGDLVQGNVMINRGNDLLVGNRRSYLYIISLQESTSSPPLCLMAKATPTQAWLWHRRLSHLNFDYINLLSNKDIVIGLLKLKYVKDQLCSSCELSKTKRSSFKSKAIPSSKGRLNLLHIDLCGPIRVASINGKKYILVIVDDYLRYTWTLFLRSKDETPEVLKDFLTMIQRNLQAPVITVCTDRGTEFLNKELNAFFKEEGIEHQTLTARTPEQKGIVKRQNHADVPSQQELDLLFGSFYDKFFNASSNPSTNIQSTSAPSTHTNVHAEENNNDQAEKGEQLQNDEFTNPFCAPAQEEAESSSHNIGNTNVPTFNQPQVSEYRWIKDHPLEQVRGNPSRPVQTRRQLETDLEMCIFALTVSTAEPKNIKEAMADSAWIEAMQE